MSRLVILNPHAGRGAGARAESTLRKTLDAELWLTEGRGHAQALTQKAMRDGFTSILAAGGDGTVNEVLNGLDLDQASLGILPVGTGNDLGRHLGILSLTDALAAAEAGATSAVDVGVLNSTEGERLFLNVAGCGFDAAVAQAINRGYRFVSGRAAYLTALVATLVRFKSPNLVITSGGKEFYRGKAMLCSVANSSSYGGGMKVAPQASMADGLLDSVVVHHLGKLAFLRQFPKVFSGDHLGLDVVTFGQMAEVAVTSDPPMPVLVDGEIWGTTPVSYSLRPRALRLVTRATPPSPL